VRAGAELIGKLLTLVVLAALTRKEGTSALGILVFSLAWAEVASLPVDMGFDRHLQRLIARDRDWIDKGFFNVFLMKARRALVVVPLSLLLLILLDYDRYTIEVVVAATVSYLAVSARWTIWAVFIAVERGELVASMLLAERFAAGALGLLAIWIGAGTLGVAVAFAVAAITAALIGMVLLYRHVTRPERHFPPEPRKTLSGGSLPFAAQDYLTAGIARADAILLSLLATDFVVGLYGGAYRLLEATLFIPASILGAMSAMFTYLDHNTEPTVGGAFARGIKLTVILLLPCAVVFAVLPGDVLRVLFGEELEDAASALRVLAPVTVLMGMVMLCGSLVASRLNPRVLLRAFVLALVVNVAANLALIPSLEETGAALAMLITELALLAMLLPIAIRAVGRAPLMATIGSAIIAAAAMAGVLAGLSFAPALALVLGVVTYLAVFFVAERLFAPDDLDALMAMLRRRGVLGPATPAE
jgi:O-antigen/teichoic acid export membrane protein